MAEEFETQLKYKVAELFQQVIRPLMQELVSEYNGVGGIKAEISTESPVMMGIELYRSIIFKLPSGVEHLICVYWIAGEERIVVENLRMVTLNRSLNIFDINKSVLKKTIISLAGLSKTFS